MLKKWYHIWLMHSTDSLNCFKVVPWLIMLDASLIDWLDAVRHVFNNISVWSVHLSMLSQSSLNQYSAQCHWLLFHITMVETMGNGGRGMNPVAMTIINARKEYWQGQGSIQRPPVLNSIMLLNRLSGLASWTAAREEWTLLSWL